MPRPSRRRPAPGQVYIAVVAAVCVVGLVLFAVLHGGGRHEPPDGSSTIGSRTSTGTSDPGPVNERSSLTVPGSTTFAVGNFRAEAGSTYLVRFDLSTLKSATDPGAAMYLGTSFRCGPDEEGRGGESRGGTQNLLPGEPVTFTNHVLVRATHDQVITCSVSVSSPFEGIDSVGSHIPLEANWQAEAVDGTAVETAAQARLPRTVAVGRTEYAFAEWFPAADLSGQELRVTSSLHLTTCTGVNGSQEDGHTWCSANDLDTAGSSFNAELRIDVVDERGRACESVETSSVRERLSLERHHRLLAMEVAARVPEDLCGDRVRVGVCLTDAGPAPLVVHASNSSLITTVD